MANRFVVALVLLTSFICQPVNANPFTAELMVRLDRVGAPAVSPDGSLVVYAVRTIPCIMLNERSLPLSKHPVSVHSPLHYDQDKYPTVWTCDQCEALYA